MARNTLRYKKRPSFDFQMPDLSSLQITLGVIALAILLFCGIVFWPSGSEAAPPPIDASETALGAKLNDPLTHSFLETLHQVDPKQSRLLHETAEALSVEGAGEEDLVLEIVAIYGIQPFRDFEHLAKADIKFIEKMITMGRTELAALSYANSKFCQLSTYEALNQMDIEARRGEFGRVFGYNSRAYKWMLRFGILQMQAIQDGRTNPKKYKRVSAADGRVLKDEATRLMKTRAISQFMREGQTSQEAWARSLQTSDMCEIGALVLSSVNELPSDLKGRMLVEMWELRKKSAIKALARQLFGDSCRACGSIF